MYKSKKLIWLLCLTLLMGSYMSLAYDVQVHATDSVIVIMDAEDLNNVRNNLSGHYRLGANIDLTDYVGENGDGYNGGLGWTPIGHNILNRFRGSFDGNGFEISHLTINRPDTSRVGLFGDVGPGAIIENI